MGIVKFEKIENNIIELRGQKVILDSDVADLYGVKTKEINQAVSNNAEKFPNSYIFELTKTEREEVVKKFDHLKNLKFSPYLPKAFTERGLYMLATILKGERATQTTLAIVDTFYRIKTLSRTIKELSTITNKQEQKSLMRKSGEIIADILDDDLAVSDSETSIEINFAVLKFKHTIKKKKK